MYLMKEPTVDVWSKVFHVFEVPVFKPNCSTRSDALGSRGVTVRTFSNWQPSKRSFRHCGIRIRIGGGGEFDKSQSLWADQRQFPYRDERLGLVNTRPEEFEPLFRPLEWLQIVPTCAHVSLIGMFFLGYNECVWFNSGIVRSQRKQCLAKQVATSPSVTN